MGHHICALAIADSYDREVADTYGLIERLAHPPVTLFPIDHYWSAYWQVKRGRVDGTLVLDSELPGIFPTEGVVRTIAREVTRLVRPRFAVILTDYFGGNGDQWAVAFEGERLLVNRSVNSALRELGVVRADGLDEWDTIGLATYRSNPDHLDRYVELCDELGA